MKYDELSVSNRALLAFSIRSLKVAAAFACALVVCAGVMPAQLPSPTKKAVAGHVPMLFPTPVAPAASTGSFEAGVAANSTSLMPTGFGLWAWNDVNALSGIAGSGTGGASAGTPPAGQNVAMLVGIGGVTHPLSLGGGTPLAAGTYRFRYKAAQRVQSGAADEQRLRVSLRNGVASSEIDDHLIEVAVVGGATTYGEFTTRAFTITTLGQWTDVSFEGQDPTLQNTAFLDDVRLEMLRTWNDSTSWNPAGVPSALDEVHILNGPIAMTGTAVARSVSVFNELVASDTSCSLASAWVLVHDPAAWFEVGRPDTPFLASFTLTLAPTLTTEDVMNMGTAFLGAMNAGRIDLHGRPTVPWTRLAATVDNASTPAGQLVVHGDATGWKTGDEIVIAGSVGQFVDQVFPTPPTYVEHSEARQIVNVVNKLTNPPRTTFDTVQSGTSSAAFRQMHYGALTPQAISRSATLPPQWTVEQRAEIGLLSHNVVVTGDPVNFYPDYGAHVMLMRCPMCGDGGGRGRFSHTEFRWMGQKKAVGRYPLHWHMQLDHGDGQFVRNCSIHQSSNRAITLHGSDYVVVEGNVAYRHMGHGIFLEDGSEEHNVIRGNLVMETDQPKVGDELLPSDNQFNQAQNQTPAMFWITNPNNIIEDNVATGSIGTGFWFIFPRELLGRSWEWSHPSSPAVIPTYQNYLQGLRATPYKRPLGTFARNLAHGCMNGFDVNDGINPQDNKIQPNQGWEPPGSTPAQLWHFMAYGCDIGIYSGTSFDETLYYYNVSGLHPFDFRNAVLTDNKHATMLASYVTLRESLFVADMGNGIQPPIPPSSPASPWASLATMYDGAFTFADCHAVGYEIGGNTMLALSGAATLHANNAYLGLTTSAGAPPLFGGTPPLFHIQDCVPPSPWPTTPDLLPASAQSPIPSQWGVTIADDGSVTGAAGTLISDHPWMKLLGPPFETPVAGSGHVFRSPLEFGLVSVQFRDRQQHTAPGSWPGAAPPTAVPTAFVSRESSLVPLIASLIPVLGYRENTGTTHHRAVTAIVDTQAFAPMFPYRFEWSDRTSLTQPNPPTPTLSGPGHLSVTLDDRKAGDVAWVQLRGIPFTTTSAGVPQVYFEIMTDVRVGGPAPTLFAPVTSFMGVNTTAAMIDPTTGDIKLRIQIPCATPPCVGRRHETVGVTWH